MSLHSTHAPHSLTVTAAAGWLVGLSAGSRFTARKEQEISTAGPNTKRPPGFLLLLPCGYRGQGGSDPERVPAGRGGDAP